MASGAKSLDMENEASLNEEFSIFCKNLATIQSKFLDDWTSTWIENDSRTAKEFEMAIEMCQGMMWTEINDMKSHLTGHASVFAWQWFCRKLGLGLFIQISSSGRPRPILHIHPITRNKLRPTPRNIVLFCLCCRKTTTILGLVISLPSSHAVNFVIQQSKFPVENYF